MLYWAYEFHQKIVLHGVGLSPPLCADKVKRKERGERISKDGWVEEEEEEEKGKVQ